MPRREIWVDTQGEVVRYHLAYVNHLIHGGDNGRVLGYDKAHGEHHRHYLGEVTTIGFKSFREIERRFEKEWRKLAKEARHEPD